MIRLSRLTDYAVVMMSRMSPSEVQTASALAHQTGVSEPTVAKVLKKLCRSGLLTSHRGAKGGYQLNKPAVEISVAEIITALDGPIALTACVDGAKDCCAVEHICPMRGNWTRVNEAVKTALSTVYLNEMMF